MRRFLPAVLLALLLALPVQAQTGSIEGVITDSESGEPLPGANAVIEGTTTGAASDLEGRYRIAGLTAGAYRVMFSFVGFKTVWQNVDVGSGAATLNVALIPDFAGLEEVVVTGIASATSRARAEVAVARVDAEDYLRKASYQDITQLLNGKVAGVSVQPSSGNIGGGVRFNMRSGGGLNGDGQPLVYLDGVRISSGELAGYDVGGQQTSLLANLNPEDIASIDVLKGPAGAALYGTSGSNGVVLITTKQGQLTQATGSSISVGYKGVAGSNTQSYEFTDAMTPTPDAANSIYSAGPIREHNLRVSGGSSSIRYFTSYETRSEDAAVPNSWMDRESFRANLEAFPSDEVSLRANLGYSTNQIRRPHNDNSLLGAMGNTMLGAEPWAFMDSTAVFGVSNLQLMNDFIGSVEATLKPIDRLQIRASVGFQGTDARNDETFPPNLPYFFLDRGSRGAQTSRNDQWTYDLNARYEFSPGTDLEAASVVGLQAFDQTYRAFFVTMHTFETELISDLGAGALFNESGEEFLSRREAGLFAQQELAYQNRYFLTLGFRQDFASAVGADAPTILYPKASAAVRLEQFDFVPDDLGLLKLRVAYGETGQLPGLLDGSGLRWGAESSAYGAGAVLSFIGNTAIKPERVKELELGLDAEFLNRVGVELTYYRQESDDSIIESLRAPSTGQTVTGQPFNVGKISGSGVEMGFSVAPIRSRNLTVDLGILYSHQTNEVESLGEAQPIYSLANAVKEGLPRSAFYAVRTKARFDESGAYTGPVATACEDASGAGVDCSVAGAIAARELIGTPYAKNNGSVTLNVQFLRRFNVYAMADWATGLHVLNFTRYFQTQFGVNDTANRLATQLGMGEVEGVEPLPVGSAEYREAAEAFAGTTANLPTGPAYGNFIEKGDFLKLREVSISCDLSDLVEKYAARSGVRRLALSLSARNVWFTSPYSGIDPEVSVNSSRDPIRGTDFLTLPLARTIQGTITVGL